MRRPAPIAAADFETLLNAFAAEPKLVGLRHVVQAEPDGFLDSDDFNPDRLFAKKKN